MTIRSMAVLAAAALLVGAHSPKAHADTPRFPDLSRYTPVDFAGYAIDTSTPGFTASTIAFLTPDGISCDFMIEQAQCTGNNFPGIPPVKTDPARGLNGANWIGTLTKLKKTGNPVAVNGTLRGQPLKVLPPFHSITFNSMTCGVDDKGTTACKDAQSRGFILSPDWSGWLPKV
ncbi:hypothetical protein [Mycolicibacterium fluoranthenivorans]|uniref:Uncharacterized protein n=1 Tax=Mycolicibacterium fluoranthenivorans TaxID=258505 RepID=A0A1G4VSS6_9MYCO|nr:hypothetical protein [Mycolicibacterium fluoranthenivorans]SCX11399.1 hypothetical protein SAMN02799620_01559 [Mycolicibacterium fluoranthenivorans]